MRLRPPALEHPCNVVASPGLRICAGPMLPDAGPAAHTGARRAASPRARVPEGPVRGRRVHAVGAVGGDGGSCFICARYLLSLGSQQGNAHVHWHVAPLPPGVPYDEQQYAASMHERGYLDAPVADRAALAERVAAQPWT